MREFQFFYLQALVRIESVHHYQLFSDFSEWSIGNRIGSVWL